VVTTPRLVIAAPASGCGKTTVATGLMAALRGRGAEVSGHKVGPDYIDPGYHALACGRPGRNLDPFLCGEDLIAPLFAHGAAGADVAVIEGVMGLFDGVADPAAAGLSPDYASTAHVARLLRAPVVLVVDAAAAGRSVAATVAGFAGFDPRVRVAGVIFNRVGSDRHERLLTGAVESLGIKVFGAIRRTDAVVTPSRHLGLVPAAERRAAAERAIGRLADLVASSCDLSGLCALAASAPPLGAEPWDPCAAVALHTAPPPGAEPWDPCAAVALHTAPPLGAEPWDPCAAVALHTAPPARTYHAPAAPVVSPSGTPLSNLNLNNKTTDPRNPRPGGGAGPEIPPGEPQGKMAPRAREDTLGRPLLVAGNDVNPGSNASSRRRTALAGAGEPVIAVAQGPAFTFSYTEHAELLRAAGACLAPFDPLADEALPAGTAGLVIGGGFPEMYAPDLSANGALRQQVTALAAAGAPVVAECAGLLYLARALDGLPMCGVIGVDAHMTGTLTLGYRTGTAASDSVLAKQGDQVRGHEFHRTAVKPMCGSLPAWRLAAGGGAGARAEGHVSGNMIASYLHVHWARTPSFAARFLAACSAAAAAVHPTGSAASAAIHGAGS
jgi:cobyrinic acid a,c-diamide synthase